MSLGRPVGLNNQWVKDLGMWGGGGGRVDDKRGERRNILEPSLWLATIILIKSVLLRA